MMQSSGYKTCAKCGVKHSTLVKHKCFKPEEQKDKPKFDDVPEGDEGNDQGGGGQGEGQGEGGGQGQGDGQGDQGQGQGDGQGDGEGEGEGEGQGQSPPPPPPPPPASVIVTVLKFAALTAASATAFIKVEVEERGLVIYAYNGDDFAERVIDWKEFEERSTIDGEYMVKEVIDQVDEELTGPRQDDGDEEFPLIDFDRPLRFMDPAGTAAAYFPGVAKSGFMVGMPMGHGEFFAYVPMGTERRVIRDLRPYLPAKAHLLDAGNKPVKGRYHGSRVEVDEYGRAGGMQVVENCERATQDAEQGDGWIEHDPAKGIPCGEEEIVAVILRNGTYADDPDYDRHAQEACAWEWGECGDGTIVKWRKVKQA